VRDDQYLCQRIAFLINQSTYFTVFWYFHFYKSYLGVSTLLVNPVYLHIFLFFYRVYITQKWRSVFIYLELSRWIVFSSSLIIIYTFSWNITISWFHPINFSKFPRFIARNVYWRHRHHLLIALCLILRDFMSKSVASSKDHYRARKFWIICFTDKMVLLRAIFWAIFQTC